MLEKYGKYNRILSSQYQACISGKMIDSGSALKNSRLKRIKNLHLLRDNTRLFSRNKTIYSV